MVAAEAAVVEIIWIFEALRTLATGGDIGALFDKPGFVSTMIWLAAIVPMTVIALGIGVIEWGDTPLGRWFGAAPSEPIRSLADIDADLKKYETWRDLDGDGRGDF
jgi:hypothetical protein